MAQTQTPTAPHFPSPPSPIPPDGAGNFFWLTPTLCRLGLLALIAFAVLSRILYLNSPQAVDLAQDEAQYWVWSRFLDWSYYSKGPMVALVIRAATELFGNTMPGIRYAAVAIGAVMTLLTYCLTTSLFRSERLALGAVALTYIVPMFIAGSMLMTIDPPFVMFWALATACFALAALHARPWAWPLGGFFVGMSFLAKYSALILLAGMLLALLADRDSRRYLRHWGPWTAILIAALCTTPVLYWNAVNGWVSAAHVKADTASGFKWTQPIEFIGGQIAVVGPLLLLMIGGILLALRTPANSPLIPTARPARFLVLTVTPYLAVVLSSALFTNAQLNWTAPAWFALIITAAWFVSTRLPDPASWKRWRGVLYATLAYGLLLMPFAHNMPLLYPAFAWVQTNVLKYDSVRVRQWDPTARLRGWKDLALELDQRRLAHLGPDAFFLVEDYGEASAIEFYAPGHPTTYVMGTFIEDPKRRGRMTQWNMWPNRSLERGKTQLLGRNAIYIGRRWKVLDDSFERIEQIGETYRMTITVFGKQYELANYRIWALYNFKGMPKPTDGKKEF
jgi:hypothetical protein